MSDFLSREPYIKLLKSIIENQKDNSTGYSFAIDGDWGCGKTWLINELENKLLSEKEKNYLIFHYNAWENDFYEEPLIAIISIMIDTINTVISQKSLFKSAVDELTKEALQDLQILVTSIIKEITKIDIDKSLESKKTLFKRIKNGRKIQNNIDTYIPLQRMKKTVRNSLLQLSMNYNVLIVVDELDRCLPEYAIKVLERLHHVCDGMPVIQILSINKENLSESIAKVFGKDYSHDNGSKLWTNLFCESYLQKFVDMIIPLPNGKIDSRLEVLGGLEKEFHEYIRPDNGGREFIKVNDEFLASFVSTIMNGIEKRLQEKIFKQVLLCHKLTKQSGIQYKEEDMTYAILIYEIISCICRYVYHSNKTCELSNDISKFYLDFNKIIKSSIIPETTEFILFRNNLIGALSSPVNYIDSSNGRQRYPFEIIDTNSYILAFFTKQEAEWSDPLQNGLWRWIAEDKIFLQTYDEIMNIMTIK